eukprot:GILK01009844.1.p1 GENE.GILK01009844.1~~GILK01009844.1.p1  ORF type:complete len:379 (-),score=48.02 GILK01009844.1:358-1458(-)
MAVRQELSNAVRLVGTCLQMCPAKQMRERESGNDFSIFEAADMGSSPSRRPRLDPRRAVKKYYRSTVDSQFVPEDIRPPAVLTRTLDFLLSEEVLGRADVPFHEVYAFVRDRSRSVRQDFTVQQVQDSVAVEAFERIARFHIVSCHVLCEESSLRYDDVQNTEQLSNCLITLSQLYDLHRQQGRGCPNEAEFRAYDLLLNFHDPQYIGQLLRRMPPAVLKSDQMNLVLRAYSAFTLRNFRRFFLIFESASVSSVLSACLLNRQVVQIRIEGLKVLNKMGRKGDMLPASYLQRMFGFNSIEHGVDFCTQLGIPVVETDGYPHMVLKQVAVSEPSNQRSLVRRSAMLDAVLNGRHAVHDCIRHRDHIS